MIKRLSRLTIALAVLSLAGTVEAEAQTGVNTYTITPAEFSGKGEEITSLVNSSTTTVEKVFLYNVGTDRFLNAGSWWGTQAATFTVGLPITLGYTSSGYTMQVSFENSGNGQGNYLGYCVAHTGFGSPAGFFLDRDLSASTGGSYWTFNRVTTGFASDEYVYELKCNNYYIYDGKTITIERLTRKTDNETYPLSTAPSSQSNDSIKKCGLWKIITQKELTDNFANTYDHVIDPSDASFLIRGQNFNRQNKFRTPTATTSKSDITADNGWYNYYTGSSAMTYINGADTTGFTGAGETKDQWYGMYYCSAITQGKAGDELVQKVVFPKRGWYRLDCEACYRNTTDADNVLAEMFCRRAGASTRPDLPTSTYAYVDIWKQEDADPNLTVKSMKTMGQMFYYDYYPVHAYIYVSDATDGKKDDIEVPVEFGLRLKQDVDEGNYVFFDDFELKFLGDEMVLSENEWNINPNADNTDYKNRLLLFERKMTTGSWNSFTVPFNMTKEKVQIAFGYNAKVAEFVGFDTENGNDRRLEFKVINMQNVNRTDTVLYAGKCYLFNPTKPYKSEEYWAYTAKQTSPIYYYYTLERISLNKVDLNSAIEALKTEADTTGAHTGSGVYTSGNCNVSFRGSYVKLNSAPINSYVFSGNKLIQLTGTKQIKGYRAWLSDSDQTGDANARRHPFGVAINGVDDGDVTLIEGLYADDPQPQLGQAVYDLSGRLVRSGTASLDGLPKGIYVAGGKKYVVK